MSAKEKIKHPFYSLANNGMNEGTSTKLRNASRSDSNFVYAMLESSEAGISMPTSNERIKKYGPNEVQHDKAPSWLKQLFKAFINPFIFILLVIAIISFVVDVWLAAPREADYKTIIMVAVMVLFSALLRFFQEFRSNQAADKLKSMVKTTATVLRKFMGKKEIAMTELVPGDIVFLSAGDMVPADCRIMQSKDLFISESMLTGEALPVEKTFLPIRDADTKQPVELNNLCFMGTNVVSGTAMAIVVATGNRTYFGSISKTILGNRPETAFDIGINKVSYLLIRFMLVMVPVIFLVNGFLKGDWMQALLFAIAVAVGLTPEMLPMIVTANLAKGAMNMSKHKVIVKRLNAIQNIGAMDILCTDKTGTLTLDKIVLEKHLNVLGAEDDEVLKWAYLNSFHQTGLKNILDKAVLEHVELHDYLKVEEYFMKVDEIPFDFQRRRMSVILKMRNGNHLLICKGAVEEILDLCSHSFDPGEDKELHLENDKVIPMDKKMHNTVLQTSKKMNEEGLRVLLVAIREFDGKHPLTYSVQDENNLTLTGFIGFLDPAKPSAKPSIAALQGLGIGVKVLTGDNEIVTKKICNDVGIPVKNIVLGTELETMTQQELADRIDDVSIFAKLSPLQKVRVVKALREKGHTVGFMGDGINDAAALKEADVGISVDTAVDIAKESADIILLEKDLMVLRKGVIYGRRTFGNIIKYIKMTASSNFGNMFSMLGASAFLPFLPMLPVQLLTQNLLYDISQTAIPWDRMDEDFLKKPKKWDASSIQRFMFFIGPISSIFDFATFALMFFYFKANSPELQSFFQSGWFIEGLLSQTLIIHMIRTKKIPFIQSWAATPVVALTTLIMLVGIAIPFSPLAPMLKMQPLPLSYFPFLFGILTCYCLLTQFVKTWFIKKFNQWL
ncbi:Magnesium-transporting ATPase, P-type 1 [Flavobacterium bizetiae]|uniref:Magnesium-transporting ATPase, P-type 1 n=1 Tax=Flavobacterium bizetiae TaxID=2704140 RepID=A0A6J4G7U6_9FLAO|nr:magnesium-translocating P-type ATPase [Flavobacterium bizetiae]CAA9194436.1 Magnesium-transporting ATPase, P-type 1 [Flavobacterium bizetiae]CAD5340252.1 Magnesium-transporting ATPase, P-type 1 [Flavobacterium bizetiae]CAD5348618.1 Magnesium-transporting ATPase, P-type 1 [Flavobacterium bizetiae]